MIKMFPYPVPPSRSAQSDVVRVVRASTLQQIKRLVLLLIVMQFVQMVYLTVVINR